MDHHDLDCKQKFISPMVIQIVDHHDDTGFDYQKAFPNLDKNKINTKFPRCSNMALVLEYFFESETMKKFAKDHLPNSTHDFLLCCLVVDSMNFDIKQKGKKWVEEDLVLAKKILDYTKNSFFFNLGEEKQFNTKDYSFFFDNLKKHLIDVKFDPKKNLGLGVDALLRKDSKVLSFKNKAGKSANVSFHSLPVSIDMIRKEYHEDNLIKSVNSFASSNQADLSVLICRNPDGSIVGSHYLRTQDYLNDKNMLKYMESLNNKLCSNKGEIIKEKSLYTLKSFESFSRKGVVPVLEEYISGI